MKNRLKRFISFTIATLVISMSLNLQPVNNPLHISTVSYVQAKTTQSQIVYITDTGEKYHISGCRYLKKSKIKTTLKKAKAEGYEPCSKCNLPE